MNKCIMGSENAHHAFPFCRFTPPEKSDCPKSEEPKPDTRSTCRVCERTYTTKYGLQIHKHTQNHFVKGESRARSGKLAMLLIRWHAQNKQGTFADANPHPP